MRYTVLTYIFDGYEQPHEVGEKDPNAEYILVTDDPTLYSKTWEVVVDHRLKDMTAFEKCYEVRFHPFRWVKNDIVVRLDASIGILQPFTPLINEFVAGGYDRSMMIHPQRNRIDEEYEAWMELRGYPFDQSVKCCAIMQDLGYKFGYQGLFQACFEIVKKNRTNTLINDLTFDFLRYAAADGHIQRVNQTWLSFVINHFFANDVKILPVSERIVNGGMMQWYRHNSNTPQTVKDLIEPYMFNEPVKVWR